MRAVRQTPFRWPSLVLLVAVFSYFAILLSIVFAADTTKMQAQALSVTAQLNGNCSATLIHSERDSASGKVETYFLTAKHCVDGKKVIHEVDLPVYQDGRVVKKDRYIAKVYGKHYRSDLALIKLIDTQTWFPATATIAPEDTVPAMGSDVYTVGYPLGLQLAVTGGLFGSLESIDYPKPGTEYFRATPAVVGGNSGGALYHVNASGDFDLLGVTSAGHRAYPHVAFYVPLHDIHDYLRVALPQALASRRALAPA